MNKHVLKAIFRRSLLVYLILLLCTGCQIKTSAPIAHRFEVDLLRTKDYPAGGRFVLDDSISKPIIINFWFPSCPPCVEEMPDLNEFYHANKTNVDVLGIQLIGLDSLSDGQEFVNNMNIAYAVGPDLDGSIAVNYSVHLFPTTIFVDQTGHITRSWQGIISKNEIEAILNSITDIETEK